MAKPELTTGQPPAPPAPSSRGRQALGWIEQHWVELASLAVAAVVGWFLITRNSQSGGSPSLPAALGGGGGNSSAPSQTTPTPPVLPDPVAAVVTRLGVDQSPPNTIVAPGPARKPTDIPPITFPTWLLGGSGDGDGGGRHPSDPTPLPNRPGDVGLPLPGGRGSTSSPAVAPPPARTAIKTNLGGLTKTGVVGHPMVTPNL